MKKVDATRKHSFRAVTEILRWLGQAHGVYGVDSIRGILVCLTGTKKDTQTNKVIEICLPIQRQLYQRFIAQLKRVYYLDVPGQYKHLAQRRSSIAVKAFGSFFHELEAIVS